MSHSKMTRALLSVLVLSSVPLMAAAISDDVDLRLDGADRKHDTYLVREGDKVGLSALAQAGDDVWILAAPADDGIVDWSSATMLMEGKASGFVKGELEIPKGNAGHSFVLLAFARDAKGEELHSNMLKVEVLEK